MARSAPASRSPFAAYRPPRGAAVDPFSGKRRWEAAETGRLNKAHWGKASGAPVDNDIAAHGATLRARSTYEAANNPFLDGAIDTHKTDIVGEDGPSLQIVCEDDGYSDAVEALWQRWWASPDRTGKLSGADMLGLAIEMVWLGGEYFFQIDRNAPVDDPIRTRLQSVHPRRVWSDFRSASTGESKVVNGVKLTAEGMPLAYFVHDSAVEASQITAGDVVEIQAAQMIHGFRTREPHQVRGVPIVSSSLQGIGDLREYDVSVLDAARQACDNATLLYTEHPDAEYVEANESTSYKRRQISTLMPGWKAQQIKAEQPMVVYQTYRAERLREIGRPISMPLMMVQLDAGNHNYASARFDGQVYHRGIKKWQRWLTRAILDRLLGLLVEEGRLLAIAGRLPGLEALASMPLSWRAKWTWPVPPHVDPLKEEAASDIALSNGTKSKTMVCAANGADFFDVLAQVDREKREENALALARIVELQKAIDAALAKTPSLKGLGWAHIVAMPGATTAPGAYLQAAMADAVATDKAAATATDTQPAGGRMARFLNGAQH